MKKIIINENKYSVILSAMLNEELGDTAQSSNNLIIKKYLDDNFTSEPTDDKGEFDGDGNKLTHDLVGALDANKNIVRYYTDVQLFNIIQEKFKNVLPNQTKEERAKRDEYLKEVLIAWYQKRIDSNGIIVK